MERRRGRVAVAALVAAGVVVMLLGLVARAHTPPSDNPYGDDQLLIGFFLVPAGAFVAWRRPEHRLGWLVLLSGVLYWITFAGQPCILWLIINRPEQELLIRSLLAVSVSAWLVARGMVLALVPLCYPDPRPRGRLGSTVWWMAVAGIGVAGVAHSRLHTISYFQGTPPTGLGRVAEGVEPWAWRLVLVASLMAIGSMLVRVARMPPDERRQHLPVAATATVLLVPLLNSFLGEVVHHDVVPFSETILVWTTVAFPIVLLYGVLRHGILDIRVVVRRSTVYVLTAVGLAAAYGAVLWVATTASAHDDTAQVVATGVVALLAMPLYVRVHRLVDHHLFGRRGDAAAVLSAISATVEQAPQGAAALELATDTVRRELRVPFVAVDLTVDLPGVDDPENGGVSTVRAAASGTPVGEVERFPLTTAEGTIGDLVVARRTAHEPFGREEQLALCGVASHVAVLARNIALTEQLLASRRQLVTAREEERRRIRRDLHDGLGPTLASVCLGLGAAGERIGTDTELGAFLGDLEDELHAAVDDIRRLVYDLRPPALDDLGLVGAVRDHVASLGARAGDVSTVELHVESSDLDVELPAAVEVAAYRIALEAITNVTRHAFAHHCWVRFHGTPHVLSVEVEDDGRGIDDDRRAGVGLRSMRDRAVELGGELLVRTRVPNGTVVRASLPLALARTGATL